MTKISATAYMIAAGLAKLSEMPRWKGYFSEEMVSLNRAFMGHGKDSLVKRLVSLLPPRLMTRLMDRLYVPGMTQHYLFRKRWIESHVRGGLDRGVTQVVILGAGHRRHAAAQLLGRKEIAAIVLDKAPSDDQRLMLQLTVNCLRSDLRPVEKAHAFERLKSLNNWTSAELAKHLHLSKSHVTLCLSHLSHPSEIQAKIDAGEISSSTAYAISRASDEGSRKAMLDEALQGGLSRGDAVSRVKRRGKGANMTRMVCQLPSGTVTIATIDTSSLEAIGILLQKLGQQCRSAARQGYDVGTLERILADKCRKQIESTANGSSS